jgi:hypothetical protein
MLRDKIMNRQNGIITYGITPPKLNTPEEKRLEITKRHIERINKLNIDGLVIYDIQEESERNGEERPFPYLPTVDSYEYSMNYLEEIKVPKVIYRCVGKYSQETFKEWLTEKSNRDRFSVLVGAASRNQRVSLKLQEAYDLYGSTESDLLIGGVTIPERHIKYSNEHIRVVDKMKNGCRYFISQAVYNLEASKNFLSDYYYYCRDQEIPMVPIIFTLTPCGSLKTLEFMKWLGINISSWLENDLLNSEYILDKSLELLKKQFIDLYQFAYDKKIPIGCNIESVSIRKVEIDASIQLVDEIQNIMQGGMD